MYLEISEIESERCSKCVGADECNKYCELHSAIALIEFIKGVDLIKTNIGEISSDNQMIVTGHQYFFDKSVCNIIQPLEDAIIDSSIVLHGIGNRSIGQIIQTYRDIVGETNIKLDKVLEIVKMINTHKVMLMPFKTKADLVHKVDNGKDILEVRGRYKFIKWVTNKNNYKLESLIGFKRKDVSNKDIVFSFDEYMENFYVYGLDTDDIIKRLIKITSHGIIKPIEIDEGSRRIILDCKYLYKFEKGLTTIIGKWKAGKIELVRDIESEAVEILQDNKEMILLHSRYIAPYKMHESNLINIEELRKQ